MRRSLHTSKALLGLSAICMLLAAAPAQAVLLSDLINYDPLTTPPELVPKIEVGDKTFTNFTVTVTGLLPYEADPANIEVTGVVDNGDYGLKFTSASPAMAMIFAHPGAFVDVLLGFDAIAAAPFKITGVDLSFAGAAPSDGLSQIVETVYGGDDQPTLLQVSTLGASTASAVLPDEYQWVRVMKDIAVVAGETGGASVNEFTQLFIQIPEPATISLLVLGGLALFGRGLARRRSALTIAIILGLGGMLIQPGTVSAIPLSTLTADPAESVTYGDFTFDNFEFNVVGSSGKWIASESAIDVQGFTTPIGSEDGLRFAGLIAALSNVTANSQVTLTIAYDVTLNNPELAIHDVTMSFNGAPTHYDGWAQVGKSILLDGSSIGEAMVYNRPADPVNPIKLMDHQIIGTGSYTQTLRVHDRIIVEGGLSGATTISYINQTFSLIPEPAMLVLTILGLPLVINRRRRR